MRSMASTLTVMLLSVSAVAADWEPSGLQGMEITGLEVERYGSLGVYASTRGQSVHVSYNDGHTWAPWNEGLGADSIRGLASVSPPGKSTCPYSLVYAATPSGMWCRWTEDFAIADSVWRPINDGLAELDVTAVGSDPWSHVICGTRGGNVYWTAWSDSGWHDITSPLSGSGPILSVSTTALCMSGVWHRLFYVLSDAEAGTVLLRTTDSGDSWDVLAPEQPVHAIAYADHDTVLVGCHGGALCRSSDCGDTWEVLHPFPVTSTCTCHYHERMRPQAWAGADSGGVVVTHTGWATWHAEGDELPAVLSLQTWEGSLLAATETGVYKLDGAPAEDPTVAGQPVLALWPNPSSKGPTLELCPRRIGPVRVAVHDLLGRRLLVLDPIDPVADAYSLALDGSGRLVPGSYVCTMDAGGQTVSQRFVVTGP